ncbi:leucine-rich repeat protein [Treponema sp. SP13]|uniref:leucine-rich repeat domain-containing protein n=1 Tax=Treponema sp. SP13 TaxID=2789742 RepID=UPI003D923E28
MRTGFHRSGLLLSDDRTAVVSFVPDEGAESVDIPDSVTDIPASLFSGCASLKRIKLSTSLRSLPDRLFEGCSSLEKIVMPPEIDSIGRAAFSGCSSLTSIPFRAGLTELSEDVFSYCTSLTSLVIPDTVERIKSGAAADCTKLAAVVLPSSLKTLEAGAFAGCSSLRHIRISEDNDVFYVDEKDGCLYRREKDGSSVIVLRPCDFEKTAVKLIKTDEDETSSDELEKEDLSEIDRYEADARKAANEAELRENEREGEACGGEKTGDTTDAASDLVEGQGDDAAVETDADDSDFDAEKGAVSDAKEPVATLSKKNDNSDTAENRPDDIFEGDVRAPLDKVESEEPAEKKRHETSEEAVCAPDAIEAEAQDAAEPDAESGGEKREYEIINFDGEAIPDEIEICKFNNRESSDIMEKKTMPNINQASVDEIFKKASEVKSENVQTADDGFKPISQDELNMLVTESDILRQNTPTDITVSASAQEHDSVPSGDSLLKRIAGAAKKYECVSLANAGGKSDWNDSLYVFAEGLVLDASGGGHFSKALKNCCRRIAAIHKYSKIFMYYGLPFGDDEFAHLFTGFIAERNTVYACSASKMSLLSEDAKRFASLAGISLERDQIECTNERAGNPETKLIKIMLQDDYSA